METVNRGKPAEPFIPPAGVNSVIIDVETGGLLSTVAKTTACLCEREGYAAKAMHGQNAKGTALSGEATARNSNCFHFHFLSKSGWSIMGGGFVVRRRRYGRSTCLRSLGKRIWSVHSSLHQNQKSFPPPIQFRGGKLFYRSRRPAKCVSRLGLFDPLFIRKCTIPVVLAYNCKL